MNRKRNIAINCRVLLPKRMEGIARYIYETSLRLTENNPDDQFFLIFDRAIDSHIKSKFPSNTKFLVAHPQARHPVLFYIWFEYMLPRLFKKHRIDLFYSPESFLSIKTKIPTLIVTHDIAFETYRKHLPKTIQKYLVDNGPKFHKRADHVVAVSEFTRQDIIKHYDVNPSKITVAGNATPSGFKPISEIEKENIRKRYTDGNNFLLYVGAIHPRKNVDRLIEAFNKSNEDRNLTLLLVGRMAWGTSDLTKKIDANPKVIHLANIGPELKTIMAAADMLCYVSLFEGFGIPLLEAMSCDVPVLTSEKSSMSEVGGEAAYYVNPSSIESIASGIETVMSNTNLRSTMIGKGRERVKDFSWDITSDKIEKQLYNLGSE